MSTGPGPAGLRISNSAMRNTTSSRDVAEATTGMISPTVRETPGGVLGDAEAEQTSDASLRVKGLMVDGLMAKVTEAAGVMKNNRIALEKAERIRQATASKERAMRARSLGAVGAGGRKQRNSRGGEENGSRPVSPNRIQADGYDFAPGFITGEEVEGGERYRNLLLLNAENFLI
jgi:hypothetical protein